MTFNGPKLDDSGTTLRGIEDNKGDYVKLPVYEVTEAERDEEEVGKGKSWVGRLKCRQLICGWVMYLVLFSLAGVLAFVFFRWVAPMLMDKVVDRSISASASVSCVDF